MLRKCPHHGLHKWLQMQTFYNGLGYTTRTMIRCLFYMLVWSCVISLFVFQKHSFLFPFKHDYILSQLEGNVLAGKKALVAVSRRLQDCIPVDKTRMVGSRPLEAVPHDLTWFACGTTFLEESTATYFAKQLYHFAKQQLHELCIRCSSIVTGIGQGPHSWCKKSTTESCV